MVSLWLRLKLMLCRALSLISQDLALGAPGLAQEWGEEDHSGLKLRVRKNAKDVVVDDVEYAEQEFQTA